MGFDRFGLQIALRLALILVVISIASYLLSRPGYTVAALLTIVATICLIVETYRFISRTNQEVARFLNAARFADFGQRFDLAPLGTSFVELGDTFTDILKQIRQDRTKQQSELRQLKAMLEHVPVPLISVGSGEQVTLWNNSARRLFGITHIACLDDLKAFGTDLPEQIMAVPPGERRLVPFQMEQQIQSLSVVVSEITFDSETERLISLQNIQSELDAVQLEAWQDLVRVLTHEIMNSITPVSSLSKTAADLLEDVSRKLESDPELSAELADVIDAVNTVARRSDGLLNFVSSYRQLTQLPALQKDRFKLADLFAEITRIVTTDWPEAGPTLTARVEPGELDLFADRQMIAQVLINLLQNAQHALSETGQGQIELLASLNQRGHVTIEVADNGPGIADKIAARIFVPFFTTRKQGSGVGLAFSRQVMIAHGGTISFSNRNEGGALFTLSFH